MTERPIPTLTQAEARVLGVLIEKQLAVPDTYPLTLNALIAGCNQKTSREPVMAMDEREAREALDSLRHASLVIESSGSRVMRYEHNARRALGVPSESVALLATLMLRGPQTSAELRTNAERLQRFSDASALEGFLEELAAWPAGPLVTRLPRQPGAREQRWAHLLCGAPVGSPIQAAPMEFGGEDPGDRGRHGAAADAVLRIGALEQRVAQLEAQVRRLCGELGIDRQDPACEPDHPVPQSQ